ncbi:MAG: hypothetical protein ACTHMR_23630, partial [Thermomicrobiales bacterium]
MAELTLAQPARTVAGTVATAGDRWGSAVLLTIAAVALGGALQVNDGRLAGGAILLITVALTACGSVFFLPPLILFERHGAIILQATLAAGLLAQLAQLVTKPPAYGVPSDSTRFKNWFLILAV